MTAHTDIPTADWIDRRMPAGARPYLRLMRLDRPIGVWLLLLPCLWSLALAGAQWREPALFLWFALGAVVMRGAGCTINDIADRDIDARVERTRGRPLPSGQVSLRQAVLFLGLQLALGLVVLLQLNLFAVALGAASLLLVFPYPLMKRITWWPQAFLGLTFNWGALLGWAAATGALAPPAVALYVAGFFWTLGYDTIYAHQDKVDDEKVGVKSTARLLGRRSKPAIALFYALSWTALLAAGWLAGAGAFYYLALAPALAHLGWQLAAWNPDDPADCLAKFKASRWTGWIVLASCLLAGPG
ncbi:MAG TPA: 4-hydroxybenzoate octaprenyltransferase [Alphaproteobacteria bacterium]|nr:4-hydroxybenzoate octaprenyltransferase [Alphaproteobacteria bacterium]